MKATKDRNDQTRQQLENGAAAQPAGEGPESASPEDSTLPAPGECIIILLLLVSIYRPTYKVGLWGNELNRLFNVNY